jgi:PST family polysaccharide transporter
MKKIWKYSLYQFGFNFVNYFSRNLDNLLISKFFGEIRLGYYNKAYELTTYPISNIVHVITPILHPVLSEYQNQKEYIYMQYIKLVRLLSSIGIFFSAVCFFSCKELIFVLYGEKWIASVVCLKYLSISIWSQMICSSIGVAFQSTGNTRSMLKCGGINTCLSIAAIVIGLISGSLRLFCISIAVAFNLHLVMPFYYLMRDSFQKKMTIIVHELLPDAVILTVLLVTLTFFSKCILIKTSMFFTLIIKVVIVFSIYMILMLITGRYKIWRVIKKI